LRRKQAKQDFDTKMRELQANLTASMSDQFRKELNNSVNRVQDAIAPYTRFVRAEQQKTEVVQERLQQLSQEILELKSEIERQ
jgi:hypothetical protein